MDFAAMLAGGDRRSIGRADEVVAALGAEPARFGEAWDCLLHDNPVVRMRAADALEKYTRARPAELMVYKRDLLTRVREDDAAAMRWHLVAMASRLALDDREAGELCGYLDQCLRRDGSRIVRVMALQAACDILARVPAVEGCFEAMMGYALFSDMPSVRARARRLLRRSGLAAQEEVLF
jgi:hypothetical protein